MKKETNKDMDLVKELFNTHKQIDVVVSGNGYHFKEEELNTDNCVFYLELELEAWEDVKYNHDGFRTHYQKDDIHEIKVNYQDEEENELHFNSEQLEEVKKRINIIIE